MVFGSYRRKYIIIIDQAKNAIKNIIILKKLILKIIIS